VFPGGAEVAVVPAVGQNGCAAAVSGGAACGLADIHPVAHQLADQLEIGGFGAARTCRGELEVGLCKLNGLYILAADSILLQIGLVHGDFIEIALLRLHLLEGRHDQGFLGRACRQAHAAAQAVIRRNLHAEEIGGSVLAQTLCGNGGEERGNSGLFLPGQEHGADCRMGADHGAAVALNAGFSVPLGNRYGHAALGIDGGAVFPGAVQYAVLFEYGNGELVALLAIHGDYNVLDKGRGVDFRGRNIGRIDPASGNLHRDGGVHTGIHGLIIQIDNLLTSFFEVRIVVVPLHVFDGNIQRDYLCQGKESSLQDIVGALPQTDFAGNPGRVDDIEPGVLAAQIPLHLGREMLLQIAGVPRAVEQVDPALLQVVGGVVLVDIGRSMNGHKIGRGDQIRRADRIVAKSQMGLGQSAGFHRVIGEIGLRILVCSQTDGGNCVLVGAHSAVAAKPPDLAGDLAGVRKFHFFVVQ